MVKLKKYLSISYFIALVVLLAFGCSTPKPIIIEREIPVPIPAYIDTTIVLRDTVVVQDSAWYGEVTDSLGKVIGDLTVYFKKKIASINLHKDTVYVTVKDTIPNNSSANSFVPIIYNSLTWWEQGLLAFGSSALLGLIIWLRLKRGKVI